MQASPTTSIGDIGRTLRLLRKRQALTQAEAAGLTGVGVRFMSELENGKPTVRLETLIKVLRGYGLQIQLVGPGLADLLADDQEDRR
jgi:HTH-type transcriptional regulator / antitoxin HipB